METLHTILPCLHFHVAKRHPNSVISHWNLLCPDPFLLLTEEHPKNLVAWPAYHDWLWLHVCPSCHAESQTWAFLFIQDYEASVFFILEEKNKTVYYIFLVPRVRNSWSKSHGGACHGPLVVLHLTQKWQRSQLSLLISVPDGLMCKGLKIHPVAMEPGKHEGRLLPSQIWQQYTTLLHRNLFMTYFSKPTDFI